MNNPYGRDDLMAMAAVRYCIGRQTYIVSYCREWLVAAWPMLSDSIKAVIRKDVEEAFDMDDADRERAASPSGSSLIGSFTLGTMCNRNEWEDIRALWKDKPVPHDLEQT